MAAVVKAEFPGQTLYEILGVAKEATADQIKKAYFKKALQWHPDKNPDPEATKKFQALSWIHQFLNDAEKRKVYDSTGSIEEAEAESESESFDVWYDYWRNMFPAVTVDDIVKFEDKYRGSAEEAKDVLEAYEECEGDMDGILDNVMCSRPEDEDRFVGIIQEGITKGKVTAHVAFTDLYGDGSSSRKPSKRGQSAASRAKKARASRAASEAKEADEVLNEMKKEHVSKGGKAEDGLAAMIMARQKERAKGMGSLLDNLAAKYGAAALEDGDVMDEEDDGGDDDFGSGAGARGGRKRKAPSSKGGKASSSSSSSSSSSAAAAAKSSPPKRKK